MPSLSTLTPSRSTFLSTFPRISRNGLATRASLAVLAALLVGTPIGCSGTQLPATTPDRESGQSGLMAKTYAGQNKCNANAHDRPFVVEWDATDTSSFEGRAASDVVVVRYEGCKLEILDGCADESIHGAFGTYRPIDWTSGSVEKIDIANEAELVAKLPLGVASLEGRVAAGEQFRMEYFVAGTRTATRAAVKRKDLAKYAACAGATHFVYGYNLGAFALGSAKDIAGGAGGGTGLLFVGGKARSSQKAEKRGGLLDSCRGESAREVATCKTPIRLSLRAIAEDDGPAPVADVSPAAGTKAEGGTANRRLDTIERAGEYFQSANRKMQSRDGAGCLADLDAHDRLNPKMSSAEPKSLYANIRATCLMLAGQCTAGRILDRKAMAAMSPNTSAEQLDAMADGHYATYCAAHGGAQKPRDRVLSYANTLERSMSQDVPAAQCREAIEGLRKLRPDFANDPEFARTFSSVLPHAGPGCLAKAGDCQGAWSTFRVERKGTPREFDHDAPKCAGKYTPDAAAVSEGQAVARGEAEREALGNALSRMKAKDGRCHADFDAYDATLTGPKTTDPSHVYAQSRVACMMLAGRCDDGAALMRRVMGAKGNARLGDQYAEMMRREYCKK